MVLVAEDQAITALEIKTILKRKGYNKVLCFCRGENVIEYLLKESPDFAILDIRLADDVSGIDIAKTLKQKDIPFVFISAFSDPENYETAKDMNPAGIIIKPFDEPALLAVLDNIKDNLTLKD